jgi:hypothetical protein
MREERFQGVHVQEEIRAISEQVANDGGTTDLIVEPGAVLYQVGRGLPDVLAPGNVPRERAAERSKSVERRAD